MLYAAFAAVFAVLVLRLVQLQWLYGERYGQQAEENSVRIIPKEPIRGYIYDRNGRLIVDNRPSFTVTVMPYEFRASSAPLLARILKMPVEELTERIQQGAKHSRFVPVRVKRDVDVAAIAALEENRTNFPGVDYQIESMRTYPTKAHAAHILGYTREVSEEKLKLLDPLEYARGDITGATGLEARYEWAIRGKKGAEYSTVNALGQIVKKFDEGRINRPAVDGIDLHLTMDFGLQEFAESLFADKRGALVAIDPNDGGILAFVSKPDFDPAQLSGITTREFWRALNSDPHRPLFNRATLTRYPPGSTFKMVLAIAALERGIITPSTHMQCTGAFVFGNKVFKDLHVHGSVNVVQAIQVSCNVFFYKLMLMVGL
ncbi:MAG TPA: penicillin-binding transpeptidase domain-containing protein, partial [Bacteroidota bacterium]|nr:penicillin-binding transpeptidase domain-containing protein [Bacteroidota bacterium]